jgi:hypothetical protein
VTQAVTRARYRPARLPSDYPCRDGVAILDRVGDGSIQGFTEADWRDSFGVDNGPAWDELAH